jgi:hypothetical protein
VQKRIAFVDGIISTSWSNDPRESLGQFLVREALITEEQLFKGLLRQEREGRLIGVLLLADGAVTEDDLRKLLPMKVAETIYDLFLWKEGRFEFKDGDLPEPAGVNCDLPVMGVILEGARRVDEWSRIREVFPSDGTTFALPKGIPPDVSDREERRLLELAKDGRTLAAIALEMRRSEFEAAATAFELHQRGLLAVARVQETPVGDTNELVRDLLALAAERMEKKRYDKALEAYEQVLAVDRLNQNAKKGLVSVVEARTRERALRAVNLDQVPVLKVDLKALTAMDLDAHEGFVVSRVNGEWDVRSILKLCPMTEEDALGIFVHLLARGVIEMKEKDG